MPKKIKKTVIVIGGSDPSGGAGIQADLHVLHRLGVPALSIVAAVTAQDENKFLSYESVSKKNFRDQLHAVRHTARGGLVKIGMLGNGSLIPPLIDWLKKTKPSFVILDPILRSSTGYPLLDPKGKKLLKEALASRADLLTPNVPEAEFLSGQKIKNVFDFKKAGRKLLGFCPAVLIKGGHRKGPAMDLLFIKTHRNLQILKMTHTRILGKDTHGTGCTLASAIAGFLVLGKPLFQAVRKAREVVLHKIRDARRLG